MPVTYTGAIQKKTRRRRVMPKLFRKEMEKQEMPLFECLSMDQIKKIKSAAIQKPALSSKKSVTKSPGKENRQPRVKFHRKLESYKKSPAFVPVSPNSTFDVLLKKTPLQPLQAVAQNANSTRSIATSSGNSLQLGSAGRFYTCRQTLRSMTCHSESSNSEWSRLFRSTATSSPDLIPSTPLTTIAKNKRKPRLKSRNDNDSVVVSRNKAPSNLSVVTKFPATQVTSTPLENCVFETDVCSVSPLNSKKASESLGREVRRGCKTSSKEATVDVHVSIPTTGDMPSPRIVITPEKDSMCLEGNVNTCDDGVAAQSQSKISLSTVSKRLVTPDNVLILDTSESYVENNMLNTNSSLDDVQKPHSRSAVDLFSSGGTFPRHVQQSHESISVSHCSEDGFSSAPLQRLGSMPKHAVWLQEGLSLSVPVDESRSCVQVVNIEEVVAQGSVCRDSLSTRHYSEPLFSCLSTCDNNEDEHEYALVAAAHELSVNSGAAKDSEVEANVSDVLVLTCDDVNAELSLWLEESLSLLPCEDESSEVAVGDSSSCRARDDVAEESSTQGRNCALAYQSSPCDVLSSAVEAETYIPVPSISPACMRSRGMASPLSVPGFNKCSSRLSVRDTPNKRRYRPSHYVVVQDLEQSVSARHSSGFRAVYGSYPAEAMQNCQLLSSSHLRALSMSSTVSEPRCQSAQQVAAQDVVLQMCGQQAPIPFSKAFSRACLNKCKKIGEGVYGEVFLCESGYQRSKSVLKIIPIEGEQLVNGAVQKKYEEILSEIVIAMELSKLRSGTTNATSVFSQVLRCLCVQGKYPPRLLELWNKFDAEKTSENDNPTMFDCNQLFIILELGHAGLDLEAYVFTSAHQALSVFQQVTCGLAVAEIELEFEHRDLHWGNVLVTQTFDKTVSFTINGLNVQVESKGVKATIIDFTLSRMTYEGCQIFNDLSLDPELFVPLEECRDYQFEIYTMMKVAVENDWKRFEPKTNIYWLHYMADKLVNMARYVRTRTQVHSRGKQRLKYLYDCCLVYSGAKEFVDNCLQL